MALHRPDLPTRYDPAAVEGRLYRRSLEAGVFHAEPDRSRTPFVISMPPPNITGRAHLGHGSTYTPMDLLTRYHRMRGDDSVWLPGQDHAAIATETVLIRELAKEGESRESLGRERYLERAWAWRERYGDTINEQFKELGFGPDWDRERFTMDEGLSRAVLRVFVELYRQGLIYRGTRLVNWDPKAQSTLSDAEVENEERDTFLWHLRYRAEDGGPGVVVATTRPETYLADVAVAVHPDDERYRDLIGKNVVLPIVERAIPVIADDAVESSFGTGAVKVTPAHDPTDYEIGRRHGLAMPTVIGYDGRICEPVWRVADDEPQDAAQRAAWARANERMAAYVGLDRFDARERLTADLRASGALEREEPYHTTVPVSSRSHAIIEPLLSLQWFCAMEPLAKPALEAYRSGRLRFVPERFGRTYEHGLQGIRDWNVSRQVWWGHQLPVWYTPEGTPVVAETEDEARKLAIREHGTSDLVRDPDTLDTWFSSGIWPFSILGWPERTPELAAWYPNQVMVTGRDIIFLWVSRMVMLGLRFLDELPFTTVFIAPLVFDLHGRKMSKSLGNAIDPMDLVRDYGADGTRFGILRQMRLESQELRFDERFCDEAKRFGTKLWNALRYLNSLPEGIAEPRLPETASLTLADRWILTELRATVESVTRAYDGFEFGVAADAILSFGWYRLCDWYLEATKAAGAQTTRSAVLAYALDTLVRLLHPIAPFVSEEIWLAIPGNGDFLGRAAWPVAANTPAFPEDHARFEALVATVDRLRNARADLGIGARDRITVHGAAVEPIVADWLRIFAGAEVTGNGTAAGASFQETLAALTIEADRDALRERYTREIARLEAEVARGEKKLANEAFIAKAKPDVVAAERAKLDGYRAELVRARDALRDLS